jgi:hypothetical protein
MKMVSEMGWMVPEKSGIGQEFPKNSDRAKKLLFSSCQILFSLPSCPTFCLFFRYPDRNKLHPNSRLTGS